MPNNYTGNAAAAVFSAAVAISLDGEPFQYGDATSGYFGVNKACLDRIAWLKLHNGVVDANNTWTGTNTFQGATAFQGTVVFDAAVGLAEGAPFAVGSGSTVAIGSGADLTVLSGGTLTLASGSIVVDAGNRTITGTYTFDGTGTPGAPGVCRAINGGEIHVEAGSFLGVHAGGGFNAVAGSTLNILGTVQFDGSGSPQGSVSFINGTTVLIDGASELVMGGPTLHSGNSAYVGKRITRLTAATQTVQAHHFDKILVTGGITASTIWTLADVPNGTNHPVRICVTGGSFAGQITLKDSAANTIAILSNPSSGPPYAFGGLVPGAVGIALELTFDGTQTPKWDITDVGVA